MATTFSCILLSVLILITPALVISTQVHRTIANIEVSQFPKGQHPSPIRIQNLYLQYILRSWGQYPHDSDSDSRGSVKGNGVSQRGLNYLDPLNYPATQVDLKGTNTNTGARISGRAYQHKRATLQTKNNRGLNLIHTQKPVKPMSPSPSDDQLFTTSFTGAMAAGLSETESTLFATEMVNIQLILRLSGLHLGTPIPALAQAFQRAKTTGISKGMGVKISTQFAEAMIRIQAIFGAQDTTISTFADSYSLALISGIREGLNEVQAKEFALTVIRIQADFGIQSEATVTIFAKEFKRIWKVGVGEGVTEFEAPGFTRAILRIQARKGTLSLEELMEYVKQFLSTREAAINQGQTHLDAEAEALLGLLVRGGVTINTNGSIR